MRSVYAYLQERFPLALVSLLALSFAAMALGLFGGAPASTADWWGRLALLFGVYLALLLRYRVTDEWKDFAHDSLVYPNRPLQRGAIRVRALVALGVVALGVELVCVAVLGGPAGLLVYLPVLVLSGLTAVEFWARDWLHARFTLSFVIHQVVYLPLFGWAAWALGARADWRSAAGVLAATLLFMAAEVVRKFEPRTDTRGAVVLDTYTAVWGRPRAIVVIVLSLLAAAALSSLAGVGPAVLAVAAALAVAIVVARRSDRAVMVLGGLSVPVLAAAMLS